MYSVPHPTPHRTNLHNELMKMKILEIMSYKNSLRKTNGLLVSVKRPDVDYICHNLFLGCPEEDYLY